MIKGILDVEKIVDIKSNGFQEVDGELLYIQNCVILDEFGNLKDVQNAINPEILTKDFNGGIDFDYS